MQLPAVISFECHIPFGVTALLSASVTNAQCNAFLAHETKPQHINYKQIKIFVSPAAHSLIKDAKE